MTFPSFGRRSVPPLALLVGLIALPQLGETIYTPSLTHLAEHFRTDARMAQASLSLFFIGFSAGIFLWGAASDTVGRRPVMLASLAVYIAGCVGCLLAGSIGQLLAGRLVQGVGAAACSVVVQAMCREAFEGERKLQVFTLMGMLIPLSTALGPLVGGGLAAVSPWWGSFVVLLMAGAVLWTGCLVTLPETYRRPISPRPGFVALLRRMAADRRLLGMALLIGLPNGIVFSFYGEAPFLLIERRGLGTSEYGVLCMLAVCGSIVGGWLLRRMSRRGCGSAGLIASGLVLLTLASALLLVTVPLWAAPGHIATLAWVVVSGMLLFAGFTLCTTACLHRALEHYHDALGRAGALFGTVYYLLIATMTEGMSLLHDGTASTFPWYALGLSLLAVLVFLAIVRPALRERD